jgi:aminopeptidase YwaD
MYRLVITILITLIAATTVSAADLYQVTVESSHEAQKLSDADVDPVVRLTKGFLVLAAPTAAQELTAAGLQTKLIATDVDRSELAVHYGLRDDALSQYPLLYGEDDLRLYRVRQSDIRDMRRNLQLLWLTEPIPITYAPTERVDRSMLRVGVDLDSLIGLVEEDSLVALVERLQAYYRRETGTDSCWASADWTVAKFQEFGYDSVYIRQFTTSIWGQPTTIKSTIAVKVGSVAPEKEIIVCGHRDGVYNSPAADDNGSGTAGTMEIGRILADIETFCTFKFITFSGEEQGLYGSEEYADAAYANGDDIIYVLNMDMIAHYENSTQAKLYHGSDLTYTSLWQQLADSLLGLDGVFFGSSAGSDHFPFQQYGYQVTFVHEYDFSSVYHSPRDSTTYMDFNYMTKMVQASLATVYAAMLDATAPDIDFLYPNGVPSFILADQPTSLDVTLAPENGAQADPGTALLHYSIDGDPYEADALTQLFGNNYLANLPAVACGQVLEYYLSVNDLSGNTYYDPDPASPRMPIVATEIDSALDDNFETDLGWTTEILGASSGQWQRGVPVNDPGWDYDPATDADGSGQCFLTQNQTGNTDVDDGAVRLISPVFALSENGTIAYDYYLYLNNTAGGVDRLLVEINSDGGVGSWTEIARHDQNGGLNWYHVEIDGLTLSGLGVPLTSTMMLRFTANDGDPQSIVEAGVDAVHIHNFSCESFVCGDVDGNSEVNVSDAVSLIDYVFADGSEPDTQAEADVDCNGKVNVTDAVYLIAFIFGNGIEPCAGCPQ